MIRALCATPAAALSIAVSADELPDTMRAAVTAYDPGGYFVELNKLLSQAAGT